MTKLPTSSWEWSVGEKTNGILYIRGTKIVEASKYVYSPCNHPSTIVLERGWFPFNFFWRIALQTEWDCFNSTTHLISLCFTEIRNIDKATPLCFCCLSHHPPCLHSGKAFIQTELMCSHSNRNKQSLLRNELPHYHQLQPADTPSKIAQINSHALCSTRYRQNVHSGGNRNNIDFHRPLNFVRHVCVLYYNSM